MGNKTYSEVEVGDTFTAYGTEFRVTYSCKSRKTKGWVRVQGVDSSGAVKEFEMRGSDRLTR